MVIIKSKNRNYTNINIYCIIDNNTIVASNKVSFPKKHLKYAEKIGCYAFLIKWWGDIEKRENFSTNFYSDKIQKEYFQCVCLSAILVDSVFRTGKSYYTQVFLEECKSVFKKKRCLIILPRK